MTVRLENAPTDRFWDMWIALLAIAALFTVASRLAVTEWTSDLHILVFVTLIAGLVGLALGYSRFSTLVSIIFSTLYAVFIIGWLFGTSVEMGMIWRDRILYHVGWRLRVAIVQFGSGQTTTDPILFLSIMAVILWVLASSTTFLLIREGSVWPSLIPLGVTLLVIGHYHQDQAYNTRYLILFLFFTLLIIGRTTFLRYKEKWRQEGVYTTPESHDAFTKTLLTLAVILLFFSWTIPLTPQETTQYSVIWNNITDFWIRLTADISDMFVFDHAITDPSIGFFSDSMGLGSGSPESEAIIFSVKINTPSPEGYRPYWHAHSYDYFDNANWSSEHNRDSRLLTPDNFNIQYPDWQSEQTLSLTFINNVNRMANLYYTGRPTWISRPVEANIHPLSDSDEDLIALFANPDLTAGETYTIETQISLPTVEELQDASTDYPKWLNPYLQLPDDFSPNIARLAVTISDGHDTPYDIASAISSYLRSNIEYTRIMPPVPMGVDPLEWFLFEEKIGFCNYYATAQVLMLRSLGIPSRLAVGFSPGEFETEMDTYTVRSRNSHAWPEVYFMGIGWGIFEPTASETEVFFPPTRERPSTETTPSRNDLPIMNDQFDDLDSIPEETPEVIIGDSETPSQIILHGVARFGTHLALLANFLIILIVIKIVLRHQDTLNKKFDIHPLPIIIERLLMRQKKPVPTWLRRWSYRARMSDAEKAYIQLGKSIRTLGHPLDLAETPIERARTIVALMPETKQPALDIIDEYHRDKFSNQQSDQVRAKHASRLVRRLAFQARLRKIFHFGKS